MRQRTVAVMILIVLLVVLLSGLIGFVAGRASDSGDGEVGVQFAEIDVKCKSGAVWTIKTGNKKGNCESSVDAQGNVSDGICSDDHGNVGAVNCNLNGGSGACTQASGAGSCKVATK